MIGRIVCWVGGLLLTGVVLYTAGNYLANSGPSNLEVLMNHTPAGGFFK